MALHFRTLDVTAIEEIIGQGLADVTMHEVGHTLGLRHNFKASSTVEWDDIQGTSDDIVTLTSSVMGYVAVVRSQLDRR